ncbi:hypothetical protein COCSUDRAFT_34339 [Coccomyxa subellipsoidea C-169]|uniref:Uncharacterized protein n=1 Tax=Coccomyxa subellipsoidea (strain C-169) TaxID=574566 RepID=I0YKV7_COCSC|nr:hypothetical protein COCSUDRAFT_34339 [Coccomyxa subellipsoidea C-169]EIE19026.1 hypothetical protein COCSUDRAFT_34339 [Coccomyxa subellipsoidea C-169]|eukprot:XP_005643570.1 hypothetical protein COCSUDRAFT_34339 [Coccomyxa subellipsoidea C-169]
MGSAADQGFFKGMLETVQNDLKVGNSIGKIGLHAADLPESWVWSIRSCDVWSLYSLHAVLGRLGNQAWSRGVFVQ